MITEFSVHKLFTKIYEVEMLKHKKLNEKGKKKKGMPAAGNPPEPKPWLPGSPRRTSLLLVHNSTASASRWPLPRLRSTL